jgi:hypothetical protein
MAVEMGLIGGGMEYRAPQNPLLLAKTRSAYVSVSNPSRADVVHKLLLVV